MRRCLNSRCGSTFFFLLYLFPLTLFGQLNSKVVNDSIDEETYLFPINPGLTNTLAGTMGELRNTHFHSGLDVRTNNMIGAAVIASQRGYISRAIKSSFSYGNVIFITHPDGNTSLYAHLNEFKGKFADYVRQQQYNQKTFEIDLRFNPGEFNVNRGDTIAWSGNTGSSNGPHLHFDIRDKDMNALNPLDFKFEEIIDKTRPVVLKLALRTMDENSRINGRFGRFEFSVLKVGSDYVLSKPILASGKIGVEILAYDRMDNSRFQYGINTIVMKADSQQVFKQFIGKVNMQRTRSIVSLYNYEAFKSSGHRFNKLYVDSGNPQDFYNGTINKGLITVDGKDVPVLIELSDWSKNSSRVKFNLKYDKLTEKVSYLPAVTGAGYTINENILLINSKACNDTTASFFFGDKLIKMQQSYFGPYSKTVLYDLRKGVPDSVSICGEKLKFDFADKVPSGTEYTYYNSFASIYFPDSALFDTLYLKVNKNIDEGKETISIGDPKVPLMLDIKVEWLPENKYDSQKYSVYKLNGRGRSNLGGIWKNGKIIFETREFGDFVLLKDSIAPTIGLITCNQNRARFRIHDELSGIYSFEATVNGEWLLMNYEYKTGILFSEKLDKSKPLKGDFVLKVKDFSGNERVYKQKIL